MWDCGYSRPDTNRIHSGENGRDVVLLLNRTRCWVHIHVQSLWTFRKNWERDTGRSAENQKLQKVSSSVQNKTITFEHRVNIIQVQYKQMNFWSLRGIGALKRQKKTADPKSVAATVSQWVLFYLFTYLFSFILFNDFYIIVIYFSILFNSFSLISFNDFLYYLYLFMYSAFPPLVFI